MNQLTQQADYLFEKIFLQYPNIVKEIRKLLYQVADTSFDSRKLATVAKSGLLPDNRKDKKGWRKFNLNELLYLEVIKKAREFNMEYSQLSKVKELFFANKTNYIKIGEVTPTEQALVLLLSERVPISLRLFSDGNVYIADNKAFKSEVDNGTSIYIDLNTLFAYQLAKFKESTYFNENYELRDFEFDYSAKVPSRQVYSIFRFIDREDIKGVEIEKLNDGGFLVSFNKLINRDEITKETVLQYFDETEYGKIEIVKRAGKVVGFIVKDVYKI